MNNNTRARNLCVEPFSPVLHEDSRPDPSNLQERNTLRRFSSGFLGQRIPSAQDWGQLLMFEGKSCSLFRSFTSQLCGAPMVVKAGLIMRPHFAHYVGCTSDYESHPESPEHREAKVFLATHLREAYREYTNATIEYEVPIPEVKRIADLMVTFPMGWRQAHEIQLASITTEQLEARTNDYARAGVDVIWWLGKSADTPANRNGSSSHLGNTACLRGSDILLKERV